MVDGSPVPGEHSVLRLPLPPKDFTPVGWIPTHQDFEPSAQDKRDALERGVPVRVSVWDAALTSPEQARAFRAAIVIVIAGRVHAIIGAGASAVVYDRLPPPDDARPGAAGHAGIEGLDRSKGEPKAGWRARLQTIASSFVVAPTAS